MCLVPQILCLVPWILKLPQGMPLDCLGLVTRKACDSGSNGTLTIGEKVLGRLPPKGISQVAD